MGHRSIVEPPRQVDLVHVARANPVLCAADRPAVVRVGGARPGLRKRLGRGGRRPRRSDLLRESRPGPRVAAHHFAPPARSVEIGRPIPRQADRRDRVGRVGGDAGRQPFEAAAQVIGQVARQEGGVRILPAPRREPAPSFVECLESPREHHLWRAREQTADRPVTPGRRSPSSRPAGVERHHAGRRETAHQPRK